MPDPILEKPKSFTPPKQTFAKGITPEAPKEPPKEVLDREFKLDTTLLNQSGQVTAPIQLEERTPTDKEQKVLDDKTTKIEPEKKEENVEKVVQDKKEEPKSILKPPTEKKVESGEKKEEVVRQITPPSKDKVVRDYSGYSADEVSHLKQMSDGAYAYTTKLIKENKEMAKAKDSIFLQHPNAVVLTPEYQQAQLDVHFATAEAREWEIALAKCKNGQPFKPLIGFDEKTGQPKYGEEIKPTDIIEESVRANFLAAKAAINERNNQLGNIQGKFKQQFTSDIQDIQNERKRRFAWVDKPELLDYILPIEGIGDVSIKQIKSDFTNLFPAYLRNNPGVEVASDLFIALRIADAELKEARNGKAVAEIQKEEATRVEPNSTVKPKEESTINGVKTFSLDSMPR